MRNPLVAMGDIPSLAAGREIIRASFADESETYEPRDTEIWQSALKKWREIRLAE